jgi:excinuclease ABC subunit B
VGRTDEAQYVTEEYLAELEGEMIAAAESLEFERAAALRDRIQQMRQQLGKPLAEVQLRHATRSERGKRRRRSRPATRIPKPKKL